jgi:hypothetical protein
MVREVTERPAKSRTALRLASRSPLTCVECGRISDRDAAGWRGYRSDLPTETEAEDPTGLMCRRS